MLLSAIKIEIKKAVNTLKLPYRTRHGLAAFSCSFLFPASFVFLLSVLSFFLCGCLCMCACPSNHPPPAATCTPRIPIKTLPHLFTPGFARFNFYQPSICINCHGFYLCLLIMPSLVSCVSVFLGFQLCGSSVFIPQLCVCF